MLQYTFSKIMLFPWIFLFTRLCVSIYNIIHYGSIKIQNVLARICWSGFRLNRNILNIISTCLRKDALIPTYRIRVFPFFSSKLYYNGFPVFSKTALRRRRTFLLRNLITCTDFRSRYHFYLFFWQMPLYCHAAISGWHVKWMRKSIHRASVIFCSRFNEKSKTGGGKMFN